MKKTPRVSVVIPTFNCRYRVEGAIRSTLLQNPLPTEVIVVDDCSTDGTDGEHLIGIDPRVKFIRFGENRGGGAARNTGIDAASGDWVAFLDADDRWAPTKLSTQLAILSKCQNERIFACANVRYEGGEMNGYLYNIRPPRKDEDISKYFFIHGCTFQTSTLVVPTQLAQSIRFNEALKRHQDWDFVLRLIRAGLAFDYSHEALAVYWNEDDPNRVSQQLSIEPTLYWIKNARNLIAPEAAAALYFQTCFLDHFVDAPTDAVKMGGQLIGHGGPAAMAWLIKKLSRRILKNIFLTTQSKIQARS
jgi:glycosyltransferase involved in cell wall biosynthesis